MTTATVDSQIFQESMDIVETHTYYAAGIGILPFPMIDFLGITANQVWMIRKISQKYNQHAKPEWIKKILTSLLGGATPIAASGAFGSAAKAVPVIGPLLSLTVTPGLAGASTYAVGTVFVTYYENGGEFELFNPNDPSIQEQLKSLMKTGEALVKNAKHQDEKLEELSEKISELEKNATALADSSSTKSSSRTSK